MSEEKVIDILNKLSICLKNNSISNAREFIRIEIENLQGITEQNCKNTKYYFYDCYCQYCNNFNCNSNRNLDLKGVKFYGRRKEFL